mmetsp:Transcript_9381/g.36611  ORF Transcript_9381/g.36611 Transcript_9381/m.36611 type:complete len:203 (+) Transcript_9381:250-858(+)
MDWLETTASGRCRPLCSSSRAPRRTRSAARMPRPSRRPSRGSSLLAARCWTGGPWAAAPRRLPAPVRRHSCPTLPSRRRTRPRRTRWSQCAAAPTRWRPRWCRSTRATSTPPRWRCSLAARAPRLLPRTTSPRPPRALSLATRLRPRLRRSAPAPARPPRTPPCPTPPAAPPCSSAWVAGPAFASRRASTRRPRSSRWLASS